MQLLRVKESALFCLKHHNISTARVVAEQWKNVGNQWHEEEQDRSDKCMVFMRNEKCK